MPTDEQKKYDKEYEEFVKQLEQEKEKYDIKTKQKRAYLRSYLN